MDEGLLIALTKLTGIQPAVFLLVSALVTGLMAAIRVSLVRLGWEDRPWWKIALLGISMAIGIGVTCVANATGNYGTGLNWADLVLVGIANGLVGNGGWQVAKNVMPLLRKRLTTIPPAPSKGGKDGEK